jgi:hypothetical protein
LATLAELGALAVKKYEALGLTTDNEGETIG